MNGLTDQLRAEADRGEPRGADAVWEAAHARASVSVAIRPRRLTVIAAAALLVAAGITGGVVAVANRAPVEPAPSGPQTVPSSTDLPTTSLATPTTALVPDAQTNGPVSTAMLEQAATAIPAGLTLTRPYDFQGNGYVFIENNGIDWGMFMRIQPSRWRAELPNLVDLEPGRIEAQRTESGGVDDLVMVDDDGWLWKLDVRTPDVVMPWRYDAPSTVIRSAAEYWLAETVKSGYSPHPDRTDTLPTSPPTLPPGAVGADSATIGTWRRGNWTPVSPPVRASIGVREDGSPVTTSFWLVAGAGNGPGLCFGEDDSPSCDFFAVTDSYSGMQGTSGNGPSQVIDWRVDPQVAALAFTTADGTRHRIDVARPFADLGVNVGVAEAHLRCEDIVGGVDRVAVDGSVIESYPPTCLSSGSSAAEVVEAGIIVEVSPVEGYGQNGLSQVRVADDPRPPPFTPWQGYRILHTIELAANDKSADILVQVAEMDEHSALPEGAPITIRDRPGVLLEPGPDDITLAIAWIERDGIYAYVSGRGDVTQSELEAAAAAITGI